MMAERMSDDSPPRKSFSHRVLDDIERLGNKLPDPALLFVFGLVATWLTSKILSGVSFSEIDPRTVTPERPAGLPLQIVDLLTAKSIATFLATMVKTFTDFHPLGVVLVAMLGVGVAERTGFITAGLKALLNLTPKRLLTPMLIFVGLLSHTASDAGYVLVIPLGGVLFQAAGRHPLVGVAVAFASVSGGFGANPLVSALDPLLAGITQVSARMLDPQIVVNPLSNYYFTATSSLVIIVTGWVLTDKFIEPRISRVPVDGDDADAPALEGLTSKEKRALWCALGVLLLLVVVVVAWAAPLDSSLRSPPPESSLIKAGPTGAPLMSGIIPLIFLAFVTPSIVYGVVAGTVKTHHDVVAGMTKAMSNMGGYLVMVFFAAIFIDAFNRSNLGALLALKGASFLREIGATAGITVLGVIFFSALIDLLVGSASAKWALLSPILIPMSMSLGVAPELTQAGYRIGDSCVNIVTPMMPYFPLVVVFCRRYVKSSGIGTLVALMLPYSVVFLIAWTGYLFAYWAFELPLGPGSSYTYPTTR
jgi:aminobenzoyl-glutamate transport protein